MEIVIATALGCILDLLFGDPQWMPHPIRFIGWMISGGEKILRKACRDKKREYLCGLVLSLAVMAISFGIPLLILWAAWQLNGYLAIAIHAIMCYQILAAKSLKDESMKVYEPLQRGDLPFARKMLSRIVSRDTDAMDEEKIIKSTVETISENTSDGVIAPLLFLLIGGAPLGFFYKAVNTLDSMIGYKNEVYLQFGRFAAKLDDYMNYIPARVSAWFMLLASVFCGYDAKHALYIYRRDKNNHASPNSGHTEAVCAGALGIQLAGPNYYFGRLMQKPVIGDARRPVEREDIRRANRLMYGTFLLTAAAGLGIRIIILMKIGW